MNTTSIYILFTLLGILVAGLAAYAAYRRWDRLKIVGGIEKFERETGITLGVKNGKPYFGGYLDLRGTSITALPDGLTVGGSLDFKGSLDLEGCTSITALPEGLTVGGDLYLRGTSITALPKSLSVGGYLYLRGCTSITALPEGLTVGGSLNLEGCTSITALPDGLTVGGSLDLRGTGITTLPKSLSVGGKIYMNGKIISQEHDTGDA